MRHGKKNNHLSRTYSHRQAMLSNMATSLILHKRIETTVAKAKALRIYIEPIITRSKTDSTHSRRTVFSYLQSKEAVITLFKDVAAKVAERPGGYTRIIKTGNRLGDNADMCMMELVDFNELYTKDGKAKKAKSTRRRGSGAGKKAKTDSIPEAEVISETTDTAEKEVKPKKAPRKKKEDKEEKTEE